MKQDIKNLENLSDADIKSFITLNFLNALDEMSNKGIVKNPRQFASIIMEDQSTISKLKLKGRYVTLDIICKAVNLLGLNANHIFLVEETPKEKLIREGVVINSEVSGDSNNVINGKNNTVIQGNNNGNVYNAEKIIQGMPVKERKELKKYLDNMIQEMLDLKKMLAHCQKELSIKDKKLMETQEKLIKFMEIRQNKK